MTTFDATELMDQVDGEDKGSNERKKDRRPPACVFENVFPLKVRKRQFDGQECRQTAFETAMQ